MVEEKEGEEEKCLMRLFHAWITSLQGRKIYFSYC